MISYFVNIDKFNEQLIEIKINFTAPKNNFNLVLPIWRPGRYMEQSFAKNIYKVKAQEEGVAIKKSAKNIWSVSGEQLEGKELNIVYQVYANVLDAGGTYLDEYQLYMNPVTCCMFVEGKEHEEAELILDLPADYDIATSLARFPHSNTLIAKNYQELADSPFIASNTLRKLNYEVDGVQFYLWFQGELHLKKEMIIEQFQKFTRYQIEQFGSFPEDQYHFLFQITAYPSYHGVEHEKNTVIALGPGFEFNNQGTIYKAFLHISSHELYHAWNIKKIRPVEMLPYDFTQPCYTELGYVAEGVTTYMGDLILFESGVINEATYKNLVKDWINKHLMNGGRFSLSVAESSYDTWLDGYEIGAPNRKVSIYNEGALIALICDAEIRKTHDKKKTLHHLMKELYETTALQGKGYDADFYWDLMAKYTNKKFAETIRRELCEGTSDYLPFIKEAIKVWGWNLELKIANTFTKRYLGVDCNDQGGITKVVKNDIVRVGDEIVSINEMPFNYLSKYDLNIPFEWNTIKIKRQGKIIEIDTTDMQYNEFHEAFID